eukprot:scaffold2596_cov194-Alexandrium_tamarense.AAC.4
MASKRKGIRITAYCSLLMMYALLVIDRAVYLKKRFVESSSMGVERRASMSSLNTPVVALAQSFLTSTAENRVHPKQYAHRVDQLNNKTNFIDRFQDIFLSNQHLAPNNATKFKPPRASFAALLIKDDKVYCRKSQMNSLSRGRYFVQMLRHGMQQHKHLLRTDTATHGSTNVERRLRDDSISQHQLYHTISDTNNLLPVLLKHDDSNGCYPSTQTDKYEFPKLTWSIPFNNVVESTWCSAIGIPSYKSWRDLQRNKEKSDDDVWDSAFSQNRIRYPWESKLNKAVWRGSTTFNKGIYGEVEFHELPRARLVAKGKERSSLIDAAFHKFVGKYEMDKKRLANETVVKDGIPLKDMMKYKGETMLYDGCRILDNAIVRY